MAHELDEVIVFLTGLLLGNAVDFQLDPAKIQHIDLLQPYKMSRRHNALPIIHFPRFPGIVNKDFIEPILLWPFQQLFGHPNLINPTLLHNRGNQLRHLPDHMHMVMPIDVGRSDAEGLDEFLELQAEFGFDELFCGKGQGF